MDIMDMMKMLGNKELVEGIGKNTGTDANQLDKLISLGLPTIMKAMNKNAESPQGAEALMKALNDHQDDDVEGMLKNPSTINKDDGKKIISHILSGKESNVMNNLASATGLGEDQVGNVLAQLAPMLMGALGQQKKNSNVDSSNITALLTDAMGKSSKGGMLDIAEKFLDSDKDGSIIDDVGKILGGFFKK